MAVNFNRYAIVDYETGGLGQNTQPLSIGIVILDPRRLTIADNGTFYSLIRPVPPDDCPKYGLDPVDPKALAVNKLDPAELEQAPPAKAVWTAVSNFLKYHNVKGDKWSAPIFTGWNSKYDHDITQRLINGNLYGLKCVEEKLLPKKDHKELGEKELAKAYKNLKLIKEPYGFGGDTLFRPFPVIDVAQYAFALFESLREPHKLSLDAVKGFLGFTDEGAHNALVDCLWTSEIFTRYLRIFRELAPEIDYSTEGKVTLPIYEILEKAGMATKVEPPF